MKIISMQNKEKYYYDLIVSNLKKIRQKHSLSQEEFAEKLDCSREYISRLENNREKISLKMLLKISTIFNINPQDFFQK